MRLPGQHSRVLRAWPGGRTSWVLHTGKTPARAHASAAGRVARTAPQVSRWYGAHQRATLDADKHPSGACGSLRTVRRARAAPARSERPAGSGAAWQGRCCSSSLREAEQLRKCTKTSPGVRYGTLALRRVHRPLVAACAVYEHPGRHGSGNEACGKTVVPAWPRACFVGRVYCGRVCVRDLLLAQVPRPCLDTPSTPPPALDAASTGRVRTRTQLTHSPEHARSSHTRQNTTSSTRLSSAHPWRLAVCAQARPAQRRRGLLAVLAGGPALQQRVRLRV